MEDKKEDEKEKKIPEVRFKGFTGEWETKKLGEIATMHARIGWQNLRTSEFLDDGDYMLITGTDFEDGKINFSTCRYIAKDRYEQDKNIQITNSSILVTKDGTLGKVAYVEELTKPATLNAGVFNVTIKNEDENDKKYIFQYLKAPFLMDYVNQKATGGTIKHLNQNILIDFPITLPKNKAEQEKIGEYFKSLDKLIGLHQRKLETLQKMKKAMLQKMFPRQGEGAKVPEIRFKGFTGDWEERKVDDLANRYDNLRVPVVANLRIPGSTPYYGANGIQDYVDGFTHEGEFVLVAEDGASDLKNYPVQCVNGRIWVNNHAHVLQGKENIADNKFLSYALHCADIESLLVGGGRAKLNAEIMMGIVLQIPELAEQQKIGEYFANLDKLITLQKKKCETLRNTKKAMLEKMFV